MWRETDLFGIYVPPMLGYAFVALVLGLALRAMLFRIPAVRRFHTLPMIEMTLYLVILAALLTWL